MVIASIPISWERFWAVIDFLILLFNYLCPTFDQAQTNLSTRNEYGSRGLWAVFCDSIAVSCKHGKLVSLFRRVYPLTKLTLC